MIWSERKPLDVGPRSQPSKHKDRFEAILEPRNDIRIHAVTDQHRIGGCHPEAFERTAHHERVRLPDRIRLTAGGLFNYGRDRAAGGMKTVFRRASHIRISAEKPRALCVTYHNEIRSKIGNPAVGTLQSVNKAVIAYDIGGYPGFCSSINCAVARADVLRPHGKANGP